MSATTVVVLVVLAAACLASLAIGVRAIPLADAVRALVDPVAGDIAQTVVRDQRVPRTVIGLLAGVALGLAGTVMQGVTRNPLADPGILGINAGAALAVVVGISVFGVSDAGGSVWFALVGAAVAIGVVYSLGSLGREGATPVKLALAGAALTAALTSITTLVLLRDVEVLSRFRLWTIGTLTARDLGDVAPLLPFLAVGAVVALLTGRALNALALGDDMATGLGQNVHVARLAAGVAALLLCGGATALAGPLAFVGLAAPHIARRLAGADYRAVLPLAALVGAALVVSADVVGRVIAGTGEVEAGLVVAVLGAPLMIALVRRARVSGL